MEMTDYWIIGNNVRSYRMLRGLTQEGLAEKARISVKGLQKVEAGKNGMRMETFMQISEALMVSMDVLAGRREEDAAARRHQKIFCSLVEDRTDDEVEFVIELARTVLYLRKRYPLRDYGGR